MAPLGLTKLSILVPDSQDDSGVLNRAGFVDRNHLSYFEREIPVSEKNAPSLATWVVASWVGTSGTVSLACRMKRAPRAQACSAAF